MFINHFNFSKPKKKLQNKLRTYVFLFYKTSWSPLTEKKQCSFHMSSPLGIWKLLPHQSRLGMKKLHASPVLWGDLPKGGTFQSLPAVFWWKPGICPKCLFFFLWNNKYYVGYIPTPLTVNKIIFSVLFLVVTTSEDRIYTKYMLFFKHICENYWTCYMYSVHHVPFISPQFCRVFHHFFQNIWNHHRNVFVPRRWLLFGVSPAVSDFQWTKSKHRWQKFGGKVHGDDEFWMKKQNCLT